MKKVFLAAAACALLAAQSKIEFNRDVRPILSDKCFACHGPDAKTKGVPLRLDLEDAAKGAAAKIVPRITQQNKFLRMPPESTGNTLSAAEIATLRAWIEQGMPWQKHWAFLPPVKHAGSIDTFVRARLAREGLKPSPEASRETLLRRATLDIKCYASTKSPLPVWARSRLTSRAAVNGNSRAPLPFAVSSEGREVGARNGHWPIQFV